MPFQQEILIEFEKRLLNGIDGRCGSKELPCFLIPDLALLVGNQWPSLEVMEKDIQKNKRPSKVINSSNFSSVKRSRKHRQTS